MAMAVAGRCGVCAARVATDGGERPVRSRRRVGGSPHRLGRARPAGGVDVRHSDAAGASGPSGGARFAHRRGGGGARAAVGREPGCERRKVGAGQRRRLQPGVDGRRDPHHRQSAHLVDRRSARRPHSMAARRAGGPRPRAGPLRGRPVPFLYRCRHGGALHHRWAPEHGASPALQHEPADPADPGAGGDAARDVSRAAGHPPGRPAADRHRAVDRRGAGPVGGRHPRGRDRQPRRQAGRLLELSVAQGALEPAAGRAVHPGRPRVDRLYVSRWRTRRSSPRPGPRRRP